MERSEALNEVFGALAKAKSQFKPAVLDCYNTFTKAKYASIDSIMASCTEALTNQGLIVSQLPETVENSYFVTTMVAHASGQYFSTKLKIILAKDDMQALGAAITYARRQGICAMLGIVDAEDDKGVAEVREKATDLARNLANETREKLKNFAPQTTKAKPKELPPTDPIKASDVFMPADFVCAFGPLKGKKLGAIEKPEIEKTIKWIESTKPPRAQSLTDFVTYGRMFLNG